MPVRVNHEVVQKDCLARNLLSSIGTQGHLLAMIESLNDEVVEDGSDKLAEVSLQEDGVFLKTMARDTVFKQLDLIILFFYHPYGLIYLILNILTIGADRLTLFHSVFQRAALTFRATIAVTGGR